MPQVVETDVFSSWLGNLRDGRAQKRIIARINRVAATGALGDAEPIGDGLTELRFHFGPGYRVYLGRRGEELIILLGGGDKGSQTKDIAAAKALWATLKEELR
jgi:putative addiction module killer protein